MNLHRVNKWRRAASCMILVPLALIWQCTQNPFSGDATIFSGNIRGQITLNDGQSAENVYVWLNGVGVGTRTDSKGGFNLSIPAAGKQPGGGVNGEFALYFFVSNYRPDSTKIVFRNGNVVFGQAGLDENGFLTRAIKLQNYLKIDATFDTASVQFGEARNVLMYLHLEAIDSTVMIRGYFSKPAFRGDVAFTAGFLKIGTTVKQLVRSDKVYQYANFQVGTDGTSVLPVPIDLSAGELSEGDYEVAPFLFIQHPELPTGLVKSLGSRCQDFHQDYLSVPVKIRGNWLKVVR
jgi:hypothetical protein